MPTVEITLEQLRKFLKRFNNLEIRRLALLECLPVLENTLRTRVFTYEEGNVTIATKDELRKLIRGGGIKHNPGKAPKGKSYNSKYLARKSRMGEDKPHKYEDYSFWNHTDISYTAGTIIMKTEMSPTKEGGTGNFKDGSENYLQYHERHRSVLKTTFLLSWQEIIETILEVYAEEAKNG